MTTHDRFTQQIQDSMQPTERTSWKQNLAAALIALALMLGVILIASTLPTPAPCPPAQTCDAEF